MQRCCRKCGEPGEDNKVCNSLNFLCRFSCITFFDLLALAIVVIWLGKIKTNFISSYNFFISSILELSIAILIVFFKKLVYLFLKKVYFDYQTNSRFCEKNSGLIDYGNTGCQVFKWEVQNWRDFCLKLTYPKEMIEF